MISIREYAKSKNVSYEAIRKQINRYKNELEGHISKVGRTQFLDDEAISFLDGKRAENPIIIMEAEKDEELAMLRDENKKLLLKLTEVQEALLKAKDQSLLAEQQKLLLEDKEKQIKTKDEELKELQEKHDYLQGENKYLDKAIEEQGEYLKGVEQEKKEIVTELEEVRKMNIFQFMKYKKRGNT